VLVGKCAADVEGGQQGAIGLKLVSPFAFAFGIALTFFEFLVQCLQAYIFTLLTALYIGGAIADEH